MNYSKLHNVIWLAPERCGTKVISKIFENYGFFVYNSERIETKSLKETYHSHSMKIPENFQEFEVYCSVRNPYDRVLSVFVNLTMTGKDAVYTKKTKENFRNKFRSFINEIYDLPHIKNQENNRDKFPVFNTYITKYRFDEPVNYKFIKMENLKSDLDSIPFLQNCKIWNTGGYDDLIKKNKFITRRPYVFSDIFTCEMAKKVYDYHKNIFYLCDYDPFSFTKETLPDDEKKKFLHGII